MCSRFSTYEIFVIKEKIHAADIDYAYDFWNGFEIKFQTILSELVSNVKYRLTPTLYVASIFKKFGS